MAVVHIPPHLQNILGRHHQLFSNFMSGAALLLFSHLLCLPKKPGVKVNTGGGSSPSPSADNPCHRPSFGSEREVSDKSSLPSVEEEGKTEMNRGVSEEGERREVEK